MIPISASIPIERDVPIPTWFNVGGRADRLARPRSIDELRACINDDAHVRILGDGANLLVADGGVRELVVLLSAPEFVRVAMDPASGIVHAGAGANLPRLIIDSVREGLEGLEVLAGIPATIGGAAIMNAGGKFGQFADVVSRVHAVTRTGETRTLERADIAFSYRHSGLEDLIITGVDLQLRPTTDAEKLRRRQIEIMQYKKLSQPLKDASAGCCFKNPTLERDIDGVGLAGDRVSAGLLIDQAGCKGMALRSAEVSGLHGNFLTARAGGRADDVIALIERVTSIVRERFDVRLTREVVIWGMSDGAGA